MLFTQGKKSKKPADKDNPTCKTPIIDWYYDNKMTKENFAPDIFDSEDESREKKFLEFIYNKDKEKLEQITVEKCLYELEQMNTLIK